MSLPRLLLAAVALTSGGAAAAQTRTPQTVLMSPNERARAGQEQLGYADAVVAGDMIYLSGIVVGKAPNETSLEPGFDRAFRQIGKILERAGAGYADIVDMTSYHTDVVGQIDAMSAAQKRLLGSPPPAWTAVQVVRLLPEGGIAEIKIVARRSRPAAAAQ
ncbi:MAG TPA: Rid family hydrolase [Allosphingosinicella sp.]|nr:Rid family hydrolase [Allosphingosinicella sp.]